MKNLQTIIMNLNVTKVSNEEFYKLIDLKDTLILLNSKEIEVTDFVITPYYIHNNTRLELYEYEFNLRIMKNADFNKYLLELTGKQNIEDILPSIIEIQKKCYVEILNNILDINIITNYINYLCHNEDTKNQIERCFKDFNVEQLFFQIY